MGYDQDSTNGEAPFTSRVAQPLLAICNKSRVKQGPARKRVTSSCPTSPLSRPILSLPSFDILTTFSAHQDFLCPPCLYFFLLMLWSHVQYTSVPFSLIIVLFCFVVPNVLFYIFMLFRDFLSPWEFHILAFLSLSSSFFLTWQHWPREPCKPKMSFWCLDNAPCHIGWAKCEVSKYTHPLLIQHCNNEVKICFVELTKCTHFWRLRNKWLSNKQILFRTDSKEFWLDFDRALLTPAFTRSPWINADLWGGNCWARKPAAGSRNRSGHFFFAWRWQTWYMLFIVTFCDHPYGLRFLYKTQLLKLILTSALLI